MILCTQCGHSNPDGAVHCASCSAPLPAMATCPSCHASVAADAWFCAHCGTSLRSTSAPVDEATTPTNVPPAVESQVPPTEVTGAVDSSAPPMPIMAESQVPPTEVTDDSSAVPATEVVQPVLAMNQPPDLLTEEEPPQISTPVAASTEEPPPPPVEAPVEFTTFPDTNATEPPPLDDISAAEPPSKPSEPAPPDLSPPAVEASGVSDADLSAPISPSQGMGSATQIQQPTACLMHVRTETSLSIPVHLHVVHIGKPNDRVPPDIDVSGFPDSDVVSRVHADLRLEAEGYYIEDAGSSNGTYVNNQALRTGDRYRLRTGDRISLGKEDKVSFIFQAG